MTETETATELKCPDCGAGFDSIVHEEKVYVTRSLVRVEEDGTLIIEGQVDDTDFESGEDEHLHCTNCTCDWPLPEKVDYV